MVSRKIKVRGSTLRKVDHAIVAEVLGAKIVTIPEISREEAEGYEQVGSPVMVPQADKLYIFSIGSRMLSAYGKSLDEVVGYRILDQVEEPEFRRDCGDEYATVICYYMKKK